MEQRKTLQRLLSMASLSTAPMILFFALSLVASSCIAADASSNGVLKHLVDDSETDFDFFTLSVNWPPTYCKNQNYCCPLNGCCRGEDSPYQFTIHGLWADFNNGSYPKCCKGLVFDPQQIEPLADDLYEYWPTLTCGNSSTCYGNKRGSFWAHEYEYHGSCATSVLGSEYEFFRATLDLFLKYNVTQGLMDAGFKPTNLVKYKREGIKAAIKNWFSATPHITCRSKSLSEVRLCFTKDFRPRDCDLTTKLNNNCAKNIYFPAYPWAEKNKTEVDFDYFVLALQWPPTPCKGQTYCCAQNGCCRGEDSPYQFTIHGLWPNYADGTYPSCCKNLTFDAAEVKSLDASLYEYWPTLTCGDASTCYGNKRGSFWAHEYETHGSCADSVLGGEYQFFNTTIDLYLKYNVTQALLDAGIKPTNLVKYKLANIKEAIRNWFTATPHITCKSKNLREVRLCFTKNFLPRDCDATAELSNNCAKNIYFPAYPWAEQNETEAGIRMWTEKAFA